MARITHKVADAFIRKYNKHIAIKNYSKMKLDAKIKAIDSHTSGRWLGHHAGTPALPGLSSVSVEADRRR